MMRSSTVANSLFIISGFLVVAYNEHFEFASHHGIQWTTALESLPDRSDGNVRLLFVADPQLKRSSNQPLLLGSFMKWDADRYLTKYFRLAMSAVKPHVVIFMGDFVGEDNVANGDEFAIYADRFKAMFSVPDSVLPIFVAGDKDLGGGDQERAVRMERAEHFENYFSPINEIIEYKHIRFYKIDFLPYLHAIPEPKLDTKLQKLLTKFNSMPSEGETRVLLSHHAISDIMLHRHITIMQTLHPSYAFSGHSHDSGFVVHDLQKLMKFFNNIMNKPKQGNDVDPRGNIKMDEYKVPTCNYATGVPNTAYGVASIGTDGELHYALLWLPSRFRQLRCYMFYLIAVGLYTLWKWCRRRRQYR